MQRKLNLYGVEPKSEGFVFLSTFVPLRLRVESFLNFLAFLVAKQFIQEATV